MKILAENKFGHGAKYSWLGSKVARALRPKLHKIGMAPIPFDWTKGAGILAKTGKLPIENQGQSSSCGGQAKKRIIEILRIVFDNIRRIVSAKSIYSREYAVGGGMTVGALKDDIGANLETDVPSYENGNPPSEKFMTDRSWITPAMIQKSSAEKGLIPLTVKIDIESMAQAIRDYGAIIMLIRGQNNGTWLSTFPVPPTSNQDLWGHYMCSADVPAGKRQIDFYQSWGEQVGDAGIQSFDDRYIKSGYITDVIAFDTKESITAQKISIIQKLLVLYQQLLAMMTT